jgi:hypothetical protein
MRSGHPERLMRFQPVVGYGVFRARGCGEVRGRGPGPRHTGKPEGHYCAITKPT